MLAQSPTAIEEARRGENKIGTTKKGIGPCYVDKYKRCGIRIADLLDEELFKKKLELNLVEKELILLDSDKTIKANLYKKILSQNPELQKLIS